MRGEKPQFEEKLPLAESLTVEFKSDVQRLSDNALVEALVCLANSKGGELWLGVEDNGDVTGLHPEHMDISGLPGLIAAKTSPSLQVKADLFQVNGHSVARITVPIAETIIATTAGKYLQRRVKSDGTPECFPMLPHDQAIRVSKIGMHDVSAQPVPGATLADFDPLERERLRQTIQQYGGDKQLLELSDEDLDGALGLTQRSRNGGRVPTLTGLLLIGREAVLREYVPTHQFAFQVLEREDVRFNEFHRYPLLKAIEWLETNFRPFNPEREMQFGLFRIPVPNVEMSSFREAVANALVHRDYHALGAVHLRLDDHGFSVSNPGGLVEGVTLSNILTTEPIPRNPLLADAMKRIGIVERTGRGVDKIYRGVLRFGRPAPDYGRTNEKSVVLQLATVEPDKSFLRLVTEAEGKQGRPLPLSSLIILAALRKQKKMSVDELSQQVQRETSHVKEMLGQLIESGLVEAYGRTRQRSYTLSRAFYQAQGENVEYTRQLGFSDLQNEQMVLAHVGYHGRIRRTEVIELCHLQPHQATVLLNRLKAQGKLLQHGQRRWTYYTLADDSKTSHKT